MVPVTLFPFRPSLLQTVQLSECERLATEKSREGTGAIPPKQISSTSTGKAEKGEKWQRQRIVNGAESVFSPNQMSRYCASCVSPTINTSNGRIPTMEILETYLRGMTNAEAYRRGFNCAIRAAMNWGFSTGDVSGQLMVHLDSLTKPLPDPNETQTKQDTD